MNILEKISSKIKINMVINFYLLHIILIFIKYPINKINLIIIQIQFIKHIIEKLVKSMIKILLLNMVELI